MSEKNNPKPGEWWESNLIGGVVLRTETGWAWPNGEPLSHPGVVRPVGDGPVAYSAEVVDRLRAELAESRKLAEAISDDREREFEAKIEAYADRRPTLDELVRDEPWRVLRAAAGYYTVFDSDPAMARALRSGAGRLEREHAEKTRREQMIDTVAQELARHADSPTLHVHRSQARALADAGLLAEAGDVQ